MTTSDEIKLDVIELGLDCDLTFQYEVTNVGYGPMLDGHPDSWHDGETTEIDDLVVSCGEIDLTRLLAEWVLEKIIEAICDYEEERRSDKHWDYDGD